MGTHAGQGLSGQYSWGQAGCHLEEGSNFPLMGQLQ
jgi:hypothetical protein